MTLGDTGSVRVHIGIRTLVARDEDRTRSTFSMPTFARKAVDHKFIVSGDIPRNSMVGKQRQQISELQFNKLPTPSTFSCSKMRSQATTCSDFPSDAMPGIKEVGMVVSLEELESSRSIAGKNFPNFEMLDARIASALNMSDL